MFTAREIGGEGMLTRTREPLARIGLPYWVHFDVDVLDQAIMPAVDSPGTPGIDPEDLSVLLRGLLHRPRCAGLRAGSIL
jgi:arginase